MPKTWRLLPHEPDALGRLAADLGVAPVVAQLLVNRGLSDPIAARKFLDAPLTGLHPPHALPGAAAAADRLWAAVQARRKITVYGDYDVDGVTGTAILLQALTLLGGDVDFYVPNRLEEGYGLNRDALRQLAAAGTKVVVTVDCGICSCGEAEEARRLGLELIVTDHHEYKAELPAADALVHPRLPGHDYPFGGLSGAGVAFKVAWLVCQRAEGGDKVGPKLREFLLDAVALAAMGLVADVVPLHDENRVYVRHGLKRLGAAPTVGLKALLEAAGLGGKPVRAEDVGFKLAPRLNAAGRLGCARLVVELLTTPSPQRARDLATYLESQNQQRQQLERKMVARARELALDGPHRDDPALVLAAADWHPGVIGIVAGRLSEQLGRPVLLVALTGDGACPGSGRSIPGFALHEALAHCGEHLVSHGGHAAAAGFRVHPDRIDALREQFRDYAARHFPAGGPPAPTLVLDAEVPLSALTPGLLSQIDKLEPYGAQNPRPKFLAADLEVVGEPRRIGGGERHLTFRVRQGTTAVRCIAWGMAERLDELMSRERRCCLAATPKVNEWNGYRAVELEVADFQPGPTAALG
ncbi:MAG TPA: single-stranded-DNA-specific exonuclease RecJ [Gemmataceae bacterium]|jgi:single-stranded-DNA-specific exonuclease